MINYKKTFENKFLIKTLEWVKIIFIAFVLAFICKMLLFETNRVNGESMMPTLNHGEKVIVSKIDFWFSSPKCGDIIVFEVNKKTCYIKRVIGIPGDIVDIKDGCVYVNNVKLSEDYTKGKTYESMNSIKFPYEVKDNEYFVLGDNRMHSEDSRTTQIGPVSIDKIKGKAIIVIAPIDKIRIIE